MYKLGKDRLFIGNYWKEYDEITSTNDVALQAIDVPEGAVFWAKRQTAGRGQRGSCWQSKDGENATFSVVLYPKFLPLSAAFRLSVAVAVGIRDSLVELYPETTLFIKWPNDIYTAGGKKTGGILLENIVGSGGNWARCVVGIGINVNQRDFGEALPYATSLYIESGIQQELLPLIQNLCAGIEARYLQLKAADWDTLLADYYAVLWGYRQWLFFERKRDNTIFKGKIEGVDAQGKLQITALNGGREAFDVKEITLLHLQQ